MRQRGDWRAALAALAFFAVALKVLVPPGMMPAAGANGLRLTVPLVICTGHGPATAHVGGPLAPARPGQPDGSCAFVGHGLAAPAPELAAFARPAAAPADPPVAIRPLRLAIRELAAPPPPSRGPPGLLA